MSESESNPPNSSDSIFGDQFGANEWLVNEMYENYLEDPSSVDPAWQTFFADFKSGITDPEVPAVSVLGAPSVKISASRCWLPGRQRSKHGIGRGPPNARQRLVDTAMTWISSSGLPVGVAVAPGGGTGVSVAIAPGVSVCVGVLVTVGVDVSVGVSVAVPVGVNVPVGDGVRVGVLNGPAGQSPTVPLPTSTCAICATFTVLDCMDESGLTVYVESNALGRASTSPTATQPLPPA